MFLATTTATPSAWMTQSTLRHHKDGFTLRVVRRSARGYRNSASAWWGKGTDDDPYICVLARTKDMCNATSEEMTEIADKLSAEYDKGPEGLLSFLGGQLTIQPQSYRTDLEDRGRALDDPRAVATRIKQHTMGYVLDMKATVVRLNNDSELIEWEKTLDEAKAWLELCEETGLLKSLNSSVNHVGAWRGKNLTTLGSVPYGNPAYTQDVDKLQVTRKDLTV